MDKSFWADVRNKDCFEKYRNELFSLWERECESQEIPVLKYSDFKLFWTTGDRLIYQAGYYARRRALSSAALLALIYPEQDKYINHLMDLIYAICDEHTWCLPRIIRP